MEIKHFVSDNIEKHDKKINEFLADCSDFEIVSDNVERIDKDNYIEYFLYTVIRKKSSLDILAVMKNAIQENRLGIRDDILDAVFNSKTAFGL